MTVTANDLDRVLGSLTKLLPFAKPLDGGDLLACWLTFPASAKEDLTPSMLLYAMGQRLLDPNPPKDVPLHLVLLRYLYRLENDQPNLNWGLKADLPARMAQPDAFHAQPLSPWQLEAAQGREDHDAITAGGVLAQVGWQP